MSAEPSETKLRSAERELKKSPKGAQRAVGGGIYMRLDSAGNRRFQFRMRQQSGQATQPARTFDTWDEAKGARDEREAATKISVGPNRADAREQTFAEYASRHYWSSVVHELDAATRVQYERVLRQDVVPFWGHLRLEQIEVSIFLMDEYREWLRKQKTTWSRRVDNKRVIHTMHEIAASPKLKAEFAHWKRQHGDLDNGAETAETRERVHFASAAADRALNLTKLVLDHARGRNILNWNPAAGTRRFHNKRELRGSYAGTHTPVLASEVLHPYEVIRIAAAVPYRGCLATLEQRRGLIEVLGFLGLRPNEALAIRHRDWRGRDGQPKRFMSVRESLKPLPTMLISGDAKTGMRDVFLFEAIAEQLERIYQAQGCPSLDALVFPNAKGGFLDLNNWREQVWYPTLKRAGFIDKQHAAEPRSPGAFHPYRLRHSCATLMSAAQRPEHKGGGRYQKGEVARQLGHTVGTLEGVYVSVLDDLHGVAGKTMDEIIRAARQAVWGPLPGDSDFADEWLTTAQAAELTGISVNLLCNRIHRGALPARKQGSRYLLSRHDLCWRGLIRLDGSGNSTDAENVLLSEPSEETDSKPTPKGKPDAELLQ